MSGAAEQVTDPESLNQDEEDEVDNEDDALRGEKDKLGLTEVESLCMRCMGNGTTRFMIHKIPYFRELVIASFECEHCGERNNEVTFGGEIQIQGCIYTLECTCERDLNRQIIKSDSASVLVPSLDFEIPALTQKGEISTIEGFLSTAARNLGLYQRERMVENPQAGARVAEIIVELGRMAAGLSFPFKIVVDDCAGNSFVENLCAPHPDPRMTVRHYNRTAEQDLSLGLQPEHGTYRDNKDTNVHELLGAEFGGHKISGSTNMVMGENGEEHIELGRQEIIRIPESCPSCNFPGESLTALTDIPHFKEVIIMAFTCSQCGYKNSEVKGGGAVPSMGTQVDGVHCIDVFLDRSYTALDMSAQVTLRATSMEDLKRDVLKSDSAMVRIEELDMELSYGTLGGIYSTVEGLLTKIEENLRDSNPFMLGDSSTLHHSEELLKDKPKDKFTEVLDHLRLLYLGQGFPFTIVLRDPLGNSFISAHIGSFTPPESDPGLTIVDYGRSFEENETFGLNDMNTRDFETGVTYDDETPVLPDRLTHVVPRGMDHPTPFAQGVQDSTPSGMYFTSQPSNGSAAPNDVEPHGWVSVGPSWGPSSLPADLGVLPPKKIEGETDTSVTDVSPPTGVQAAEEYNHPRRFDNTDLTIAFKPREEFGKPMTGFVFRMGAQGLGYYEDVRGTAWKQAKSAENESASEEESAVRPNV